MTENRKIVAIGDAFKGSLERAMGMGMKSTCYVVIERQPNGPVIHSLHKTMESVDTLMKHLFPVDDEWNVDSAFYWQDGHGYGPENEQCEFGLDRGKLGFYQDGSETRFNIEWRSLQNMGE